MTKTETKTSDSTLAQRPPLAHLIADKRSCEEIVEGDLALCGAKLMGLALPNASTVCEDCTRILRDRYGS